MKYQWLHRRFGTLGLAILLLGNVTTTRAVEKWSVSSSLQYSTGNYIFEQNTSTFYLYGGLRYRSNRWQMSASIPLVTQNSDLVTGGGGTFFPSTHHKDASAGNSHHGRGMSGDTGFSDMTMGLGDLYLNGTYQLLPENLKHPYLALTARLKVPTAGTQNGFGSGEFDYGASLTLRKRFGSYLAIGEAGFWVLGDPPEVTYKDPLVVGIGAGKFFSGGRTGILFYYETYTAILEGLEPLRQLSLGLNHRLSPGLMLSMIAAAGFSDSVPDVSLSSGIEWSF
jgi:hypothetical protein